jgi:sensor histidine kinase YesM
LKKYAYISLYWKLQILGWLITSLYWGYASFFDKNFIWQMGLMDLLLDILIGIALTHLYKLFALKYKWIQLNLKPLLPRIASAILVLSILYMLFIVSKLYLVRQFILGGMPNTFPEFFKSLQLQIFITGTRLMSIWVLAYHLYHYSRREIETIKENAQLSLIAKEAQLNNLTAQLNPHFLFNSLNNIKFLVSENPESARRAIDLLSDLLRNALTIKEDRLIPLQDELALVQDYLELEKMRFENRLHANIDVDSNLSKMLIPPLCVQTLVENAIKHGIEKRKDGGFIRINVLIDNDFIKINVKNSGHLNQTSKDIGIGLKNLRERLSLQYGGNASFSISALQDESVLATISIPKK